MKKKQLIQTEQVGSAVIFKFHLSEQSNVIAPATPRKNGVWLQKCVQQEVVPPVVVQNKENPSRLVRTKITIEELLNPYETHAR